MAKTIKPSFNAAAKGPKPPRAPMKVPKEIKNTKPAMKGPKPPGGFPPSKLAVGSMQNRAKPAKQTPKKAFSKAAKPGITPKFNKAAKPGIKSTFNKAGRVR